MDCRIEGTNIPRLEDYITKYGQKEGLSRFLRQTEKPGAETFEQINADKEVFGVKFLYFYDKESADAAASRIGDNIGERHVTSHEGKDLRGRQQFKVIVTNPNPITNDFSADELAGVSSSDPFEVLTAHLNGQRRTKHNRKSNLEGQIAELKRAGKFDRAKAKEATLARLVNEISDLEENIEDFSITRQANSIKVLGAKQLAWATAVLSKEEITASEISEVNNVVDLWRGLREILYEETDEVPFDMEQAFKFVRDIADTDDLYGNLMRVMASHLSQQAKYKSPEHLIREFHQVEDMSMLREWGLDLSHTGIRLITDTDIMLRDILFRSEKEIIARTEEIFKKFTELKAKGKDVNILWQLNKDNEKTGNLLNRYSQNWYDESSANRDKLVRSLKAIEAARMTPEATKRAKSKAFREYSKWKRQNSETVDTRFFLIDGFNNGYYTKATYIAYLNGLFGETRAQEIIQQALEQNEVYEEALKYTTEGLAAELEFEQITQQEYDDRLSEWQLRNSPEVWFKQNEPGASEFPQSYNQYAVTKPKKFINGKESGWYDQNYSKIENDADLMDMYNFVREFMSEMMSYLPKYLTRDQDVHAGFLPRIQKELLSEISMKDFMGSTATMKEDWIQSFTSAEGMSSRPNEIDPATKKPYKSIPTAFIKNMPLDERSFDLDKVLAAFGKMAIGYKWKSKVEAPALLVNRFVENMSKSDQRRQHTTDDLKGLRSQLEYAIDALLYNKTKADEKDTGIKIFEGNSYIANDEVKLDADTKAKELAREGMNADSINEVLVKEFGEDNIQVVSKKRKHKHLQEQADIIEESYHLGNITEQEYNDTIGPIEEEAKAMGRSVVWSKVGDKFLRFNQALALGFNPLSAVNNYMFGITSNIVWAAGNNDFGNKESWTALGMMWKSAFHLKNKQFDKIANLIVKFNILSDSVEIKSGSINETMKKIKNSPYAMLKGGDYLIKGQTFIAMMLKEKITDLQGNERSLYQAFDNEGNWKSDEFGENKGWDGDVTDEGDLKEFLNFRNKSTQLIKKLHGNFDAFSPVKYKKFMLGKMLGQFRFSWMLEGIDQRWGKKRYDQMLDRDVSGRYKSYQELGFAKSLKTLLKLALHQASAFDGVKAHDMKRTQENMRRNLMEIYMYSVMFGIYLMLKNAKDEDNDKSINLIMTMLQRTMADTTFYLSPNTFTSIIQDPIPIMRIYKNAKNGFTAASKLMFDDELTDYETSRNWSKITTNFPGINQFDRVKYASEKVREF